MADEPDDTPSPKPDEMPNAADPEQLKKKRRRKISAEERRREFWERVFADADGRAQMWEILRESGWSKVDFGTGPNGFPQPEQSWFNQGAKHLGDRLFRTWLHLCPEGTLLMLREHCPEFHDPRKPDR